MNIGQAAKATGISTKMIRYYESIGLVAAPHRTESGYRVYLDEDLNTLRFINQARDLGFSVEQMRDLLTLWRDGDRSSADVKAIARSHIAVLEEKARALAAMSETLQHLAETCQGDDRPSCPIIEKIASAVSAPRRPAPRPRFGVAQLH